MESTNNDMTKRLKYTKDILTHMIRGDDIKSKLNTEVNEKNF